MKTYRPRCDCGLDLEVTDKETADLVLAHHICRPRPEQPEPPEPHWIDNPDASKKEERTRCLTLLKSKSPQTVAREMDRSLQWVMAVQAIARRQGLA